MKSINKSNEQSSGRYVHGGRVEIKGNRLGWWDRVIFKRAATDIIYTISAKYRYRPDLLAYDLYGSSKLQWFIMQYNNVSDLFEDFAEGTEITLPTKSRLFSELLSRSR